MINPHYSFLILTFNEEAQLSRLLSSLYSLKAAIYIMDSGSDDQTLAIARRYGAKVKQHPFQNHPQQWHHALQAFNIQTPWIIGLDADQVISAALQQRLSVFKDEDYHDIDGIYFNRKNYFKGKWIRHGGFYPFYLLKMFRTAVGFSDLNEYMDHRFLVPGKTQVWHDAELIEENLKENKISFWISKHNTYSDLLALEEVERRKLTRSQTIKPLLWGTPDQRTAWQKKLWWRMPLLIRPLLYFIYRYLFRLGFLDGYAGFIFHFLQGFWFRLIVDIKIKEITTAHDPD